MYSNTLFWQTLQLFLIQCGAGKLNMEVTQIREFYFIMNLFSSKGDLRARPWPLSTMISCLTAHVLLLTRGQNAMQRKPPPHQPLSLHPQKAAFSWFAKYWNSEYFMTSVAKI